MFEFIWWWVWFFLPLPWFVYRFVPEVPQPAAIRLPSLPTDISEQQPKQWWRKSLVILCWVCLIAATSRPVWYGDPIEVQPKHRDMLLTVDLSGSMAIEDMVTSNGNIDRLTAVKQVLSDFIQKRQGDRLGLVLFADHAYLQTPLTFDRKTVEEQLNRAVLNLIGKSTAIGEGLGIATKTFIESDAPQRVIVLLSDGANTSGVIDPLEAAELAKKSNVTIYTIGVGAEEMQQRQFMFTRTVNPSQDLDEKTLTKIAELTGGQYFRARNPQELSTIYNIINKLEPVSEAQQTWRPREEWFRFPLMGALLFSIIILIIRKRHG